MALCVGSWTFCCGCSPLAYMSQDVLYCTANCRRVNISLFVCVSARACMLCACASVYSLLAYSMRSFF